MLSYEAALDRLLKLVPPPQQNTAVPLANALGRYLAQPPVARIDLPPFDNSAMDGWAVRAEEIHPVPVRLQIAGRVAAGGTYSTPLQPGHAVRVFTGSPIPPGANAVVMQEDATWTPAEPDSVLLHAPVKPWEHVRFRGEDCHAGTRLVAPGTRLGAAHLAYLGAAGVDFVSVFPALSVTVLPNGSELVSPGQPLPAGAIYESNSLALASLIGQIGAQVRTLPPPPDDSSALRGALMAAFAESDVVVTVGGASVGDHDLVKSTFESVGGRLDFWRVAIIPGKPFFFGELETANGRKFLFGVPGNPVSAFVTTVMLVLPALRRLLGASELLPPMQMGRLSEALANPEARRHLIRVRCGVDGSVRSSGAQGSHFLSSLAASNGLVDVPPHTHWAAGTEVRVIGWD